MQQASDHCQVPLTMVLLAELLPWMTMGLMIRTVHKKKQTIAQSMMAWLSKYSLAEERSTIVLCDEFKPAASRHPCPLPRRWHSALLTNPECQRSIIHQQSRHVNIRHTVYVI